MDFNTNFNIAVIGYLMEGKLEDRVENKNYLLIS